MHEAQATYRVHAHLSENWIENDTVKLDKVTNATDSDKTGGELG